MSEAEAKSIFEMSGKVDAGHLVFLREELKLIRQDAHQVSDRSDAAYETRMARWEGQSSDGRKHEEDRNEKPFPWEGASDMTVREADKVVNYQVGILLKVVSMASLGVTGVESQDEMFATKMVSFLRWVVENRLGRRFIAEMEKWLQWGLGDSPAVSYMNVYWERSLGREYRTVTIENLAELALAQARADGEEDPERIADEAGLLLDRVADKEREAEASEWVASVFALEEKRAREVVRSLREDGEARIPVSYVALDAPRVQALRLNEDIFVPASTGPGEEPYLCFIRSWHSEPELRSKPTSEGWNSDFVDDLLEHAGESAIDLDTLERTEDDYSYEDLNRHRFETIQAIFQSVNEDGVIELKSVVFAGVEGVDRTARGCEALYSHGKVPAVPFVREMISNRQDDARGVPEAAKDWQQQLKKALDAFSDHTDQATNPPITVNRKRMNMQLVIRPNAKVPEGRPGEVKFMETADYPRAADTHKGDLRRQIAEYFGVPAADVAPEIVEVMQQLLIDRFLPALSAVMTQIVQLCAEYMDPSEIDRVVGGKGIEFATALTEIRGQYDFVYSMSSKYLDDEKFSEIMKNLKDVVLPIDMGQTVQRNMLTQWILRKMDANLAEMSLRPAEEADQKEIREERTNFALMYAGVEPQMAEEGQNFALRARVLEDAINRNPDSFAQWPEQNRAIAQSRYQHLMHMAKSKTEYAQDGRVYSSPALGDVETP